MMTTIPIKFIYDKDSDSSDKSVFYPYTNTNAVLLEDGSLLLTYLDAQTTTLNNLSNQITELSEKISELPKSTESSVRSVSKVITEFAAFPKDTVTVNQVQGSSSWGNTVKVSKDYPNVWGRMRVLYTTEPLKGDYSYFFCGSLGTNGTSIEFIYYLLDEDIETVPLVPLSSSNLGLWQTFPPSLTRGKVIYISRRIYDGTTWSNYSPATLWAIAGRDLRLIQKVVYCNVAIGEVPSEPPINAMLTTFSYSASISNLGDWAEEIDTPDDSKSTWLSIGTFGLDKKVLDWTKPIRVSGPPGQSGRVQEILYTCTSSDSEEPSIYLLAENRDTPIDPSKVYNGWYPSAASCSLSEETPALWMTTRMKSEDGIWYGNADTFGWNQPVLISIYGRNGTDGDGVLFIYLRLTKEEYQLIKEHWNFAGRSSSDDPTASDPVGVTRKEPCESSTDYEGRTLWINPTIEYEDKTTKSGSVSVTIPPNYTRDSVIYEGTVDVTIDDVLYPEFMYKIILTHINEYSVLFINDKKIVVVTAESDNKNTTIWKGDEVIKSIVVYTGYPVQILKNDVDDTDNWKKEELDNSDFSKYTPKNTLSTSDVYTVTFYMNK